VAQAVSEILIPALTDMDMMGAVIVVEVTDFKLYHYPIYNLCYVLFFCDAREQRTIKSHFANAPDKNFRSWWRNSHAITRPP
jgi:hypothetical protein